MTAAPSQPMVIAISAVEASGDVLGAALMRALKARRPDIAFVGCGGPMMAREGLASLFPIDGFAVIGPAGALKALPAAMQGADRLAHAAREKKAAAAVLIDSWSFSRLAARRIKAASPTTAVVKYVAPQVWGSRPRRAETLAALFDGVLTLFEFETPWFERLGVPTRFVGSSTFQAAARLADDGAPFRACYGVGEAPLLAVLPGSRRDEARRLTGIFGETVRLLIKKHPSLRICVVLAPAVEEIVRTAVADWPGAPVVVAADDRFAAFSAADAALAASGTVTTELAICRTPMAVGYQVGPLTELWIRSVITTPYVSMVNVAAEREVIPEFLQKECRPEALAAAVAPLLAGGPAREAQLQAFEPALERLGIGGPPAEEAAADTILDWIDGKGQVSA